MKTLLLFSGGIDSVWLLQKLLTDTDDEITALHVNDYYITEGPNDHWSVQYLEDSFSLYELESARKISKLFKTNHRDFDFVIRNGKNVNSDMFVSSGPYRFQYYAYLGAKFANEFGFDRVVTGNGVRELDINLEKDSHINLVSPYFTNIRSMFSSTLNEGVTCTYEHPFRTTYLVNKMQRHIDVPSNIRQIAATCHLPKWNDDLNKFDNCHECRKCNYHFYVEHIIAEGLCEVADFPTFFSTNINESMTYVVGDNSYTTTKRQMISDRTQTWQPA